VRRMGTKIIHRWAYNSEGFEDDAHCPYMIYSSTHVIATQRIIHIKSAILDLLLVNRKITIYKGLSVDSVRVNHVLTFRKYEERGDI
jgi:hypothetical protein